MPPVGASPPGYVPLPFLAVGAPKVGVALFPADVRHKLALLVAIPEDFRRHTYEVVVRQLHESAEVGRVTWMIGPERRKAASRSSERGKAYMERDRAGLRRMSRSWPHLMRRLEGRARATRSSEISEAPSQG